MGAIPINILPEGSYLPTKLLLCQQINKRVRRKKKVLRHDLSEIVAEDKNGNRYYDHKQLHIEKGRLLDFIEAKQPEERILTPTSGTEPTIRSERKVKELVKLLQIDVEEAVVSGLSPMRTARRATRQCTMTYTKIPPKGEPFRLHHGGLLTTMGLLMQTYQIILGGQVRSCRAFIEETDYAPKDSRKPAASGTALTSTTMKADAKVSIIFETLRSSRVKSLMESSKLGQRQK